MKFYLKVFLVSFIGFLLLFTGILFAFDAFYDKPNNQSQTEVTTETSTEPGEQPTTDLVDENDERTELQKIADASNRINVIAFGLNDSLADTIMLVSYDPDINHLDILSIPRDTYRIMEGFNDPAQKKINATYGFPEVGGVNGMKNVLSDFLGIPIDYYVKVEFSTVKAVVDTLGGYEVTIPYDMDYDDNYDTPPLHIHLKKGYQVLNGQQTVEFLRFRKSNDGKIQEGDVHRIPRQQEFVKSMINKAVSSKLPSVINTIIGGKYVQTDMTLEEALSLAIQGATLAPDNITFYTLEGEAKMMNGLSYWIHDPAALEKMLYKIYGFDVGIDETETTEEPTTSN